MEKNKIRLWILHAGLEHPSPYFCNFCSELNKYENYDYVVNPELPLNEKTNNGIVYFNRLKRFYKGNSIKTANDFLDKVDLLKENGWKIVWTLHNFFPIDRQLTDVDEYVTKEFINKCDLVFTFSEYMRKSIEKNYNIKAINHGMGINTLNDHKENTEIDKLKNEKIFTFTFIGNIYKYKLLDEVISSFSKLKNCRLIIAGRESKNAHVNIDRLIVNKKNIIYINDFIGSKDWKKLSEITDVFISLYNLDLPQFKYGFFPSNYINIARTGIKCISPKHEIIEEIIYKDQMIFYDYKDKEGLLKAMKKAMKIKSQKKIKIKYDYDWSDVVKIFVENCNNLFK